MKVTPSQNGGSHRTGGLENITVDRINKVLGFKPNIEDDPYKVVNSWGFSVTLRGKVHECGIWDYKGSQNWNSFSTCGPDEVFRALFGENYRKDRY